MQKLFLIFFIVLIASGGCRRLPNVQGTGVTALQGVWRQDSIANAGKLLNYTLYDFKITCDSFYVTMDVHAKVNYYAADSCFNKAGWKEYAKGTYLVNKDTLMLNGTYTKANFKQKISGCFNIGRYIQNFIIKKTEKEQLFLENLGNHQEIYLNLKESIICTPKSL